ncbi:MAG TPA: two-component system sensor histidine kinase CreC [Candidatus Polarisedimenticolia bacterium]|jgi:two-component system sensor histidine kinase CreC|nr:two-component system sensor histidine kinase CreC [Candidatus Polarisedimenticolia bacterium]
MKLGTALFLAYLLIFLLCFSYPIVHIANSLRTRYLESVEEPLVDQANILAAVIGHEMEAGHFEAGELNKVLAGATARDLSAKIYRMKKEHVDAQIYITDATGRVLLDSGNPGNVGADFSQWRDVRLTLRGEYGARTTRTNPEDPNSAILYVAAPIRVQGATVGTLTVAEPTTSINAFLESAKPKIFRTAALSAVVAVGLGLLVSWWVSREIGKLTRFANDVRAGKRLALPRLAPTELREMGKAFDKMKESLEGKKYVEEYVQTLTHEIKSPVSAIRGAAELLDEEMPREKRAQFLANLRHEAERIQDLIDRMLKLSELETRKSLQSTEIIPVSALLRTVLESKEPMLLRKALEVRTEVDEKAAVRGDPFLLHQALSNLLQNAIDFSPAGRRILLGAGARDAMVALTVEDQGPGIPDYAKEKLFEKFFSLPRPDTGKKSTGLGLNFVREVAALHGGEIRLENLPGLGFRTTLLLPAAR